MATAPPPLPPDVQQQQSPQQAQSVFADNGVGQPQPGMQGVQMIMQKIQEQESWLQDMMGLIKQTHPPLLAHLAPMAQALVELRNAVQEMAKRSGMAQGSPMMPGPPPNNPAAGPPNPNAM